MSLILLAISLGFLGSFHCIGMCGPIALALPVHHVASWRKFFLILSYNGGRILTYAVFGLVAGGIGQAIFASGYQQALSVTIGVLLLSGVVLPLSFLQKSGYSSFILKPMNRVKSLLSGLFLKRGFRSLLLLGLLNGLLPCGLVYMGLAGAVATGSAFSGGFFMAIFGLGTLPAMLAVSFAGNSISLNARNNIRRLVPVFISITAILLILRGLNLGIPYVSPSIEKNVPVSCHAGEVPPVKSKIICIGHDSPPKK